ncbi:hypothetical protein, partial [Chryseobacterium sp. HMWF001]
FIFFLFFLLKEKSIFEIDKYLINMKKLLNGATPLSRKALKEITGGLTNLVVYDPDNNYCQSALEIVPVGCPCNSKSICPQRFGPGAVGNNSGPVTLAGACINGVCAGSVNP